MSYRGRPISFWLLFLLLGQLSIRATLGGSALLLAPAGGLVGLSTAPLAATPLSTFIVPGVVLLVCFGLLPAGVCYGLYTNREWALWGGVGIAIALLLWVVAEIALGFVRLTLLLNVGTALGIAGLAMSSGLRREIDAETG